MTTTGLTAAVNQSSTGSSHVTTGGGEVVMWLYHGGPRTTPLYGVQFTNWFSITIGVKQTRYTPHIQPPCVSRYRTLGRSSGVCVCVYVCIHKTKMAKIQLLFFFSVTAAKYSRGNSVQWLTTDWTTRVRSQEEAKHFSSSLCVQTSSEAHSASYPLGTGGPFPGVKRGQGMSLTIHSV
jgi:hypothetical protein